MNLTSKEFLQTFEKASGFDDNATKKYLVDRARYFGTTLSAAHNSTEWAKYKNFWPPTIIHGLRTNELAFFLGAGISAASGLPTWRQLIEDKLGIPTGFLRDEALKNDNLTLGEIASRLIGREQLQTILRNTFRSPGVVPTATHYALASLSLPVYITTNYDTQLEEAWSNTHRNTKPPLAVICNATDARRHATAKHKLYKVHGSAERNDELLVLSRSDYRKHYRNNHILFEEIKGVLKKDVIVFCGFSHSDPEVSRLVDDVIYDFELAGGSSGRLDFYNMQFESDYVATERFAARGIVSLNVRLGLETDIDARGAGVSESIIELVAASTAQMDAVTTVESQLKSVTKLIQDDLDSAIQELKTIETGLATLLEHDPSNTTEFDQLLQKISASTAICNQGLYLLESRGSLVTSRLDGLDGKERKKITSRQFQNNFSDRPYFQAAKSHRKPFVSDFFGSVFNGNATFAICVPITNGDMFLGLLFGACQIGQWKTPINCVETIIKKDTELGVYLIDRNGILACPPNQEYPVSISEKMPTETDDCRLGYNFLRLKILSKKDRITNRLNENIVPVWTDDDVIALDRGLDVYAGIRNIGDLGWRCAVTRPIRVYS